jgi:transposase, IS4 family protein
MVQAFLDAHQVDASRIVVVADAGMLSAADLAALDEAGLGLVVGSRTTRAPWDLAGHIETFGNAYTDGQVIEATTPRRRRAPARTGNKDGGSRRYVPSPWDPVGNPSTWRVVRHTAPGGSHATTRP